MKLHFVHGGFGGWIHMKRLMEVGYYFNHYLMSYHYINAEEKKGTLSEFIQKGLFKADSIILDSGSFSAFSKGSHIDIDEYTDFIIKYQDVFSGGFYAGLDVIGDAEQSLKNQLYMEGRGIKPLPTYHYGEPLEYLHRYLEEYDYIGVGGLVPLANQPKKIDAICGYLFHYIKKHNLKTKIHGRGMTNPKFIIKYPFYSVDSSGWSAGVKFNRFLVWNDNMGKMSSFTSQEYRQKYNKDPSALLYIERLKILIDAYEGLEKYADKMHEIQNMKYRL